jgi:hypothetical protein
MSNQLNVQDVVGGIPLPQNVLIFHAPLTMQLPIAHQMFHNKHIVIGQEQLAINLQLVVLFQATQLLAPLKIQDAHGQLALIVLLKMPVLLLHQQHAQSIAKMQQLHVLIILHAIKESQMQHANLHYGMLVFGMPLQLHV